jgi:tyrosine-protein phosphatase SIW14
MLAGCAGTPHQGAAESCATPLDPAIQNSCVVSAELLWRGGRPDAAGAAALVHRGVKTVVNLELLLDDRETFEEAQVRVDGIREINYFRVREWEPNVVIAPSKLDDHVARFIAITRTQPKPIFVHCRSGQNRTGVMVAAYRVFNGGDTEEAVAEMGRYGGIWFKYDAEYIRGLTPQRRAELEKRIGEWVSRLRRDAQILCTNSACKVAPTR